MDRGTEPLGHHSPGPWPIDQARFLNRASLHAGPSETCGLIIGRLDGETVCIHRLSHCANDAGQPGQRFRIPAEHLMSCDRSARLEGLEIVGAWHSHPTGLPRPSQADLNGLPPGWLGLIVVPKNSGSPTLSVYGRGNCTPRYRHMSESSG